MAESLAELMARFMAERQISGYKLARLSGHSQATISRIKDGYKGVSAKVVVDIARALDAPQSDFLRAAGHGDLVEATGPLAGADIVREAPGQYATDDSPALAEIVRDLLRQTNRTMGPGESLDKMSPRDLNVAISQLRGLLLVLPGQQEPEAL